MPIFQGFGRWGAIAAPEASAGPMPTLVAFGTVYQSFSVTNMTPTYPAGLAADDILLLHIHYSDGLGNASISSVSGSWTLLQNQPYVNDDTAALYWKRATGSESGSITVTLSEGTNLDVATSYISAWRGCPTGVTPFESDTQNSQTSTSSHVGSTISTTGPNRRVISFFGWSNNSATGTMTNGWTEELESASGGGNGGGVACCSIAAPSAGSVSACTRTMSASCRNVSFTLALIPA